jgi:hypothetical protein
MSIVSVQPKSFILALFIRDDNERFLLGDNGYDFKDSQLHFAANTIENDEVQKQGADGVMVAGQVRRSSVQSFDGYVGDATMAKETIEQMRRDFIAFFLKGHHYRVIYVDCNRNAWQRKGGYLVDAPEVKELWQIHPEYHVGLNFEDVNYYSYDEDADGNEILANLVNVPVSTEIEGGLVWDEDGAVSEDAEVEYDSETAEASGKSISISDAAEAPLASFRLDGETSQNGTPTPDAPVAVRTVTGENVVQICGKNLFETPASATNNGVTFTLNSDGTYNISGTATAQANDIVFVDSNIFVNGATYTLSANQPLPNGIRILVEAYNGSTWLRHALGNNAFLDATRQSITAAMNTTGSNRIRLTLHVDNGTTVNISGLGIQLEKGSTATAYEPYQGQSFTLSLGSLELCKIGDYQDYIYKSGGKWYLRKECGKYTFTSSETVSYQSNFPRFMINFSHGQDATAGVASQAKSSHFVVGQTASVDGTFGIAASVIYLHNNAIASADGLKTWFGNNNVSVYFALATPTDTEITNETLIEQLEAVLGGHTYAGTNNIFTITPNEQGTIEVGYYTKYQLIVTGGGYVWEAGGAGGPTVIMNNSIDNVSPVWTIYGPTTNPQLENATTGETIEYVGTIAQGQTLTIDMGEQTASLDGLNVISNLVGDFIQLAPGRNNIIYSVSGEAGASELGWSEIVG